MSDVRAESARVFRDPACAGQQEGEQIGLDAPQHTLEADAAWHGAALCSNALRLEPYEVVGKREPPRVPERRREGSGSASSPRVPS